MVKAGLTNSTFAHAPSVQLIVKRQVVRNALRLDPEGARRDQLDLRLAESATWAIIADQGLGAIVADHRPGAMLLAMLILGEHVRGRDAQPCRIMPVCALADLPQAAGSRSKRTRSGGGG